MDWQVWVPPENELQIRLLRPNPCPHSRQRPRSIPSPPSLAVPLCVGGDVSGSGTGANQTYRHTEGCI